MSISGSAVSAFVALALTACAVSQTETETDDPRLGVATSHLDKPTTVSPTSGWGDPTTIATVDAAGNMNWVGGAWYVPIPVSAGDAVGTFQAVVRDNGTANGHQFDGNNVIAVLQSRIGSATSTLASASSNGSGTQQTLTLTTTHTVAAGEQLVIEFFGLKGGALPGPSTVPSMTGPVTASPSSNLHRIALPAAAWRAVIGHPTSEHGSRIAFEPSGVDEVVAPIELAVGTSLRSARFFYERGAGSAVGTFTLELRDVLLSDATLVDYRVIYVSTGTAPDSADVIGAVPIAITSGHSYSLDIKAETFLGGQPFFQGATIDYN